MYRLGYDFFGPNPKYKEVVHDEIFSLINYGNSFTFSDVYTMPVMMRRYYLDKLVKVKKQEQEAQKKALQSR